MGKNYHVSKTGSDQNTGSEKCPFLTIGKAAGIAVAGDSVIVHEGVYREWVKPARGGSSNARRITYSAAEGEHVEIKGSERIQGWENVEGTIWKAVFENQFFQGYNPYEETVFGDWLLLPEGRCVHLGDVYLNGSSFYEAESYEALKSPEIRTEILDNWTAETVPVKNPGQTKYLWFSEVSHERTTIYANFHGADPNAEMAEINVRKCCFYPDKAGVDYITVRGFEMSQAATPWAPPTADQPGLIGPNWSKGWIIEGCVIHDSKCGGISIGKEISTGNNYRTARGDKPGYQYQLESVFAARKIGWGKEKIGSHIIRGNTIYDCGQNGIVGHLGCAFCEIAENHIYDIALKREFYGHEIAGIKLHAAIDTHIHKNHVHDCSLGIWLDWQAQGARVSRNLCHDNNRDLYMEVTHGPFLVDNNIFASRYAMDNRAQGGAYVRNLFAGKILHEKILNRATPYHLPHSADVAGYAMVYGADDRFFQNIFVGSGTSDDNFVGTKAYSDCPTSLEEYISLVRALGNEDLAIFEKVEQPAYIAENVYLNGAKASEKETGRLDTPDFDAGFSIEATEQGVFLSIALPEGFEGFSCRPHDTASLGRVRIVDADFENPDGTPLFIDTDFFGTPSDLAGPLACLKSGSNRIQLL